MMEIDNPENEPEYLISWGNKTYIADVDMNFMKEKDKYGEVRDYLIVSYKG